MTATFVLVIVVGMSGGVPVMVPRNEYRTLGECQRAAEQAQQRHKVACLAMPPPGLSV